MRVLVLSDSHSSLSFMRRAAERIKPDMIIHLGDHYDDGEALHEENPGVRFLQVPGNCDRYRTPPFAQEILIDTVGGVSLYMTHGHIHRVKSGTGQLLAAARVCKCDAVLYGHTHQAACWQDESGMWVLNPGSCGYYGGSVGLMEIFDRRIVSCKILREEDLPEIS